MGFLDKIKNKFFASNDKDKYLSGFAKTSSALGSKLKYITSEGKMNADDFLEKLMVTLIECDLGYETSQKIVDKFFDYTKDYPVILKRDLMNMLSETMANIYREKEDEKIKYVDNGPTVILMIGVNGSGKTSSIAKLAKMYQDDGKKVCMIAADTFRAGAVEQLRQWALKLNVDFYGGEENRDPSSVLVDGLRYVKKHDFDIVLCDTAGRLQNKANLMAELAKMRRVVSREIEGAPHNTWLVLDANTGQNGLSQAMLFNEITDLDGIILTKMDGTSKGGIVIAIKDIIGVPVRFITFGETLNDIKPFDLDMYLYSIIGALDED